MMKTFAALERRPDGYIITRIAIDPHADSPVQSGQDELASLKTQELEALANTLQAAVMPDDETCIRKQAECAAYRAVANTYKDGAK